MSPSGASAYQDQPVSIRVKLSGLWASMLFVFAYVDLFTMYREDFRANIEVGEVGPFEVTHTFLFLTTLYVVIPSLMVFATLVLSPGLNRIMSIGMSGLYVVTIVGGAVGEWSYYVLGSVLEVILLGFVGYYAWNWPKTGLEP